MTPIKRNSPMSTPEFNPIEIAAKGTSASPKHRAVASKNAIAKLAIAALVLSGIPFIAQVHESNEPAIASGADIISLYLSQPGVQGTDVTVDVVREDFNGFQLTSGQANCDVELPIASTTLRRGTQTVARTDINVCRAFGHPQWFGAQTDSAVRIFGGAQDSSTFMSMPNVNDSAGTPSITFVFPQSIRYLGFWWPAGSAGNTVRLYDSASGGVLLAELDTARVQDKLGTSNTSTQTVASLGGGTYQKLAYFGHPRYHNDPPTGATTVSVPFGSPSEFFTYMNFYVAGTYTVKRAEFSGKAFEFDNLAVSTSAQVPASTMVPISLTSSGSDSDSESGGGGAGAGVSGGFIPAAPVQAVKADPCTAVASTTAVTRKAKNFSGFAINSARLTPAMKRQIRNWLNKHPEEVCVSVAGFTMGPRVLPTDPKLARDRARAVRAYIKSLRPDASFTPITSRTQRLVGDDIRRAKVTLRF
jgi:outer membrane protein OmpA-like peptidoglycan-associated protein